MKFIRKNGRIIPIKEKKNGQGDMRHVSNNRMANEMSKEKFSAKKSLIGAGAGFAIGALSGLYKRTSIEGLNGVVKKTIGIDKKIALKVGAIGAIAGLAGSMIRVKSKQEVADKMLKKYKNKKGSSV